MATIILGFASSHSPQVTLPGNMWSILRQKDEGDTRLDYDHLLQLEHFKDGELTEEKFLSQSQAVENAIRVLQNTVECSHPDVIVVIGDDQHEQFHDDNMPVFAVYHGKTVTICDRASPSPWKVAEKAFWSGTFGGYGANEQLGEHIIARLTEMEFDVARSDVLDKEIGIGHAFSFLYRRLLPGCRIPIVPMMINTYYPPNQPTPKRCYQLGVALRAAIESWDKDVRVAVMASGGLSHVVLDERLDRQTMGGSWIRMKISYLVFQGTN